MPVATIRGGPSGARPGGSAPAGRGKLGGGKGKSALNPFSAQKGAKRHRKMPKDCIYGISKPDIRRLARRGGVKRISATIYGDARQALKERLEVIIRDCVTFCEYRNAKTITVSDVIHSLRRLGRPIYGFDPDTHDHSATVKKAREIARAAREGARRAETDDEEMFV
ncbi:hypothetical protein DL546_008496 [Coniochaeta pulveracea]|uniref:Histone H4 n=1 Tax=Coniochaeta pulveracea TaxID=177199 RepID=A0A420YG68_9PEZI|nr:hypothetical protein DL546_008496 [Coniochaeta pulveracea]